MSATAELRNSAPHGTKREPEDELEGEQRLAKRFNLLNIGSVSYSTVDLSNGELDHDGKLYIPVQAPPPPVRRSRSNAISDSMNVDESRDRIYIHNLDEELADISSDEEKLIFLPDVEKRLNRIPKSVFSTEAPSKIGNEMILYNIPSSITVPEEQDTVRKAIIESRQRASEHALAAEHARQNAGEKKEQVLGQPDYPQVASSNYDDTDVMDLS